MSFGVLPLAVEPLAVDAIDYSSTSPISTLLNDQDLGRIYLLQADPWDPGAPGTVTIRFSQWSSSDPSPYLIGGQHWPRRLLHALRYSVGIEPSGIGVGAEALPTFGDIPIAIGDGDNDALAGYRWDARAVSVLMGAPGETDIANFEEVFKGTARDSAFDPDQYRILIRDFSFKLNLPMQSTAYAGTGGLEGGTDLTGQPKPITYGQVFNIPPVLVDAASLIYQFHDAQANGVDDVFDRGVQLARAADPDDGPVGIGQPLGDTARLGFKNVYSWMAYSGPVGAVGGGVDEFSSDTTAGGPSFANMQAGMWVETEGFANGANNGYHEISAVDTSDPADHRITVNTTLITETAAAAQRIRSDPPLEGSFPFSSQLGADGTTDEFTSDSAGDGPDLSTLVPGQVIETRGFANSANNGFFTLLEVDTSVASDHRMKVAESLTTEAAAAGQEYRLRVGLGGAGGQYITDLSQGLIRLNAPAFGPLTVDARGDVGSAYTDNPAEIYKRIVKDRGGLTDSDLDLAEFAQAASDAPYEIGIYIGTEQRKIPEVLREILQSIGGYSAWSRLGIYRIGVIKFRSSVATIEEKDIISLERVETELPVWRRAIGYKRSYVVQAAEEIAPAASDSRKALAARAYRTAVSSNAAAKTASPLARDLETDSLIQDSTDATTEAGRQQGLLESHRDRYNLTVRRHAFTIKVGDTVTIDYPRFSLSGGVDFIVLGIGEDTATEHTELRVWG